MNYNEEAARNAFKPITENPIILDFSGCKYLAEIHLILKQKFGLPEYYGENWNALWDCLDGLFWDCGQLIIEIYGFYSLQNDLREACQPMLEILEDVHAEAPNAVFKLIS